MSDTEFKATLHGYLHTARHAVVWKIEGLSEYDARRPLVATGTNLLGLVKHLTCGELGYFGDTFGRPSGLPNPWLDDDLEDNGEMWARPEETREEILGLYRKAWAHADATIDGLDLDAVGHVPWWTEGNSVTLHHILVHVTTETYRHLGHADVVRELIDGSAGVRADDSNLPDHDEAWWAAYRNRIEDAARRA